MLLIGTPLGGVDKSRLINYAVGDKVLLRQEGGISRKAQDKYIGPYTVTQVHTNGTIRIQRGTLTERLNIRRVTPYFE